jgi:hypothetical protein
MTLGVSLPLSQERRSPKNGEKQEKIKNQTFQNSKIATSVTNEGDWE